MRKNIALFSVVLFLSSAAFAATPTQYKSPSELNWSVADEKNCVGTVCASLEESKRPGIFDKVDKMERQRLTDPYSSFNSDDSSSKKILSFSFGNND